MPKKKSLTFRLQHLADIQLHERHGLLRRDVHMPNNVGQLLAGVGIWHQLL